MKRRMNGPEEPRSFSAFFKDRLLSESTLIPGRNNLAVMIGTVVFTLLVSGFTSSNENKK